MDAPLNESAGRHDAAAATTRGTPRGWWLAAAVGTRRQACGYSRRLAARGPTSRPGRGRAVRPWMAGPHFDAAASGNGMCFGLGLVLAIGLGWRNYSEKIP